MIDFTIKTLESNNHQFSVEDETTVAQLKEQIRDEMGIDINMQRLIFCGRVLTDDRSLSEFDVNGKVIHLVPRPPPSPQSRSTSVPLTPRPQMRGVVIEAQRIMDQMGNRNPIRPGQTRQNWPDPPSEVALDQQYLQSLSPVAGRLHIIRRTLDEINDTLVYLNELQHRGTSSYTAPEPMDFDSSSDSSSSQPQPYCDTPRRPAFYSRRDDEDIAENFRYNRDRLRRRMPQREARPLLVTPSDLASLMLELEELRARSQRHLNSYYDILQETNFSQVSSDEMIRRRSLVEACSDLMHSFAHVYHAASDIEVYLGAVTRLSAPMAAGNRAQAHINMFQSPRRSEQARSPYAGQATGRARSQPGNVGYSPMSPPLAGTSQAGGSQAHPDRVNITAPDIGNLLRTLTQAHPGVEMVMSMEELPPFGHAGVGGGAGAAAGNEDGGEGIRFGPRFGLSGITAMNVGSDSSPYTASFGHAAFTQQPDGGVFIAPMGANNAGPGVAGDMIQNLFETMFGTNPTAEDLELGIPGSSSSSGSHGNASTNANSGSGSAMGTAANIMPSFTPAASLNLPSFATTSTASSMPGMDRPIEGTWGIVPEISHQVLFIEQPGRRAAAAVAATAADPRRRPDIGIPGERHPSNTHAHNLALACMLYDTYMNCNSRHARRHLDERRAVYQEMDYEDHRSRSARRTANVLQPLEERNVFFTSRHMSAMMRLINGSSTPAACLNAFLVVVARSVFLESNGRSRIQLPIDEPSEFNLVRGHLQSYVQNLLETVINDAGLETLYDRVVNYVIQQNHAFISHLNDWAPIKVDSEPVETIRLWLREQIQAVLLCVMSNCRNEEYVERFYGVIVDFYRDLCVLVMRICVNGFDGLRTLYSTYITHISGQFEDNTRDWLQLIACANLLCIQHIIDPNIQSEMDYRSYRMRRFLGSDNSLPDYDTTMDSMLSFSVAETVVLNTSDSDSSPPDYSSPTDDCYEPFDEDTRAVYTARGAIPKFSIDSRQSVASCKPGASQSQSSAKVEETHRSEQHSQSKHPIETTQTDQSQQSDQSIQNTTPEMLNVTFIVDGNHHSHTSSRDSPQSSKVSHHSQISRKFQDVPVAQMSQSENEARNIEIVQIDLMNQMIRMNQTDQSSQSADNIGMEPNVTMFSSGQGLTTESRQSSSAVGEMAHSESMSSLRGATEAPTSSCRPQSASAPSTPTVRLHWDEQWAPVFSRDQRQLRERIRSQEPFSDAYLCGMPSRKRRCVRAARPSSTFEGLLNDTVRESTEQSDTLDAPEFCDRLMVSVASILRSRADEAEDYDAVRYTATARLINQPIATAKDGKAKPDSKMEDRPDSKSDDRPE